MWKIGIFTCKTLFRCLQELIMFMDIESVSLNSMQEFLWRWNNTQLYLQRILIAFQTKKYIKIDVKWQVIKKAKAFHLI